MSRCYQCGGQIAFKVLPSGRKCPTELDGSDHFDICSKRKFEARVAWYGGIKHAPKEITGARLTPRQQRGFGKMARADMSQPWFVDAKLPWPEYAPSHCECGQEYEVHENGCSVTLVCRKCVRVRIETSFTCEIAA